MSSAFNEHIGMRLRELRKARGRTQLELGVILGVPAQRIHKYESGENKISASLLWRIARVLGEDVSYFFEGLDAPQIATAEKRSRRPSRI